MVPNRATHHIFPIKKVVVEILKREIYSNSYLSWIEDILRGTENIGNGTLSVINSKKFIFAVVT